MPRRCLAYDCDALDALLRRDHGVVTHAELRALRFPVSTATYRCRAEGPWQAYLPGVVVTHSGQLTTRQREIAAIKYAGKHAVLTGAAALRRAGVPRILTPPAVRVLVPASERRQSRPEVTVERSARMPATQSILGLACAPVARALLDECRQSSDLAEVRRLVAGVVQSGHCGVPALVKEVRECQRRGSGLPRAVLREVSAGVRSVAEAKARAVLMKEGLGRCEWNISLHDDSGDFIARPDGWFDAEAVALECDSIEWHLSPDDYKRTQRRQKRMASAGILVVPFAPSDLESAPETVISDLRSALTAGAARPRPPIETRRP